MQEAPLLDARHGVLEQAAALFAASDLSAVALAAETGLTRQTVSAALQRTSDPRVSTLAAILEVLGHDLVVVPRARKREVVAFLNYGGQVNPPADRDPVPLSVSQQLFLEQGGDLSPE